MVTLFFSLIVWFHQIKRCLSVLNYWLISWRFLWLISLFFDDLQLDQFCILIVNMLRQAADRFINDHLPSLICSWFWFWFWLWLETVDAVSTVSILQGAPAASVPIRGHRAVDLRGGLRPGWALNSVQEPGTRNQDQDCLQMVHIPAGLRGAPENHRNVLSSRLPANINSPATRLHRVLKDAFTRLRADCRHELNLGRVQTVTEHFWRRSVNQTGVVLWSFWSELCGRHRNALTSGDRSIR